MKSALFLKSLRQGLLRTFTSFKAWFPYDRNSRKNRVTIFLNGQFIIVCSLYNVWIVSIL
jgi:hypothetical protein